MIGKKCACVFVCLVCLFEQSFFIKGGIYFTPVSSGSSLVGDDWSHLYMTGSGGLCCKEIEAVNITRAGSLLNITPCLFCQNCIDLWGDYEKS